MFSTFLITFRESLEAVLIVGIIVSYLYRVEHKQVFRPVFVGAGAALVATLLSGIFLHLITGELSGCTEEVFEGVLMISAAGLIIATIFFLKRIKDRVHLEKKIDEKLESKSPNIALAFLVFVTIFREGFETIVFLGATETAVGVISVLEIISGVAVAFIVGYVIFRSLVKIRLDVLFKLINIALGLFAGWLLYKGVHELFESCLF